MSDRCMARLELPVPIEQFHRLPRHPAYHYEYFEGRGWINPRPRYYHARLDLGSFRAVDAAEQPIHRLEEADWPKLPAVFASAFARQEPFACGTVEERLEAATLSLEQVRVGGDGPVIGPACLVAGDEKGEMIGALLVTLVPSGDPEEWGAFVWDAPPPEGCIERREGVPHLTWIFVAPYSAGRGLGTALLAQAVQALRGLGFTDLFSTFLAGNESSMLWHWRQGFKLLSYPGSYRRVHRDYESLK